MVRGGGGRWRGRRLRVPRSAEWGLLAELGDVADDANTAAILPVKVLQGVDGLVQRGAAERSETFVDKQHVASAELTDVAEGQRKGKRYQKSLATGEGVGRSL